MRKIRLGSRSSRLALAQAEYLQARLRAAFPEVEFDIVRISTQGDRNRLVSMGELPGVGFFVKEIESALAAGEADIAVHSLKDVPVELPPEFILAAVPEREDTRDVLISRGRKLDQLPVGAVVGSDSLRRSFQIRARRPDVEVRSIRGNIETRIKAVEEGRVDAVILAAAGLHRLGLETRIDDFSRETAGAVNHPPTCLAVTAERSFLRRLGGGCRAPIAALGTVEGDVLTLRGMVADEAGRNIISRSLSGTASAAEAVGEALAEMILEAGANKYIN
jgi:hydroxymethylbilane synthase